MIVMTTVVTIEAKTIRTRSTVAENYLEKISTEKISENSGKHNGCGRLTIASCDGDIDLCTCIIQQVTIM